MSRSAGDLVTPPDRDKPLLPLGRHQPAQHQREAAAKIDPRLIEGQRAVDPFLPCRTEDAGQRRGDDVDRRIDAQRLGRHRIGDQLADMDEGQMRPVALARARPAAIEDRDQCPVEFRGTLPVEDGEIDRARLLDDAAAVAAGASVAVGWNCAYPTAVATPTWPPQR